MQVHYVPLVELIYHNIILFLALFLFGTPYPLTCYFAPNTNVYQYSKRDDHFSVLVYHLYHTWYTIY